MASASSWIYDDAQELSWRAERQREDGRRKVFYDKINKFPNLFTLEALFRHKQRAKDLLEKQKKELEAGWFQYQLETDRCHNLIVFLHFLLDNRQEALEYCQNLMEKTKTDSIIRLTTCAVLQWEMGQRQTAEKTVESLEDLAVDGNFQYLKAVALSEQGHTFTSFGPKYFLRAIDKLREALALCPDSPNYLWRYDLALVIRRNLNILVHRAHPSLPAQQLAEEAAQHLLFISSTCVNRFYRVRSFAELASLLSAIRQYLTVSDDNETGRFSKFREKSPLFFVHKALITHEGQSDYYVLRLSGRLFMYAKAYILAEKYLHKSLAKRDDPITHQIFAKVYLGKYRANLRNRRRSSGSTDHRLSENPDHGQKVVPLNQTRGTPGSSELGSTGPRREDVASGAVPGLKTDRHADYTLTESFESKLQISGRRDHDNTEKKTQQVKSLLKAFSNVNIMYDQHDPNVMKAEEHILKALQLDPRNTGILSDAGLLYQGTKKYQQAFDHFQRIVSSVDARPVYRVNAYEQSGICLLAMSEAADNEQKTELIERAEDMFRSSLRECRRVVQHMPYVKEKLTQVWNSYSRLIEILESSTCSSTAAHLQKMAQVHEEVGKYMEAIRAHHDVLTLSTNTQERKLALLGLIRNHYSNNDVARARRILDEYEDEGYLAETDDDDVSQQLRKQAVEVYIRSAKEALMLGPPRNAHSFFKSALMLLGLVQDVANPDDEDVELPIKTSEGPTYKIHDISIFDDGHEDVDEDGSSPSEDLASQISSVSSALVTVFSRVFGMSVSRNDEGTVPGRVCFEGEHFHARKATTVVLVLGAADRLSHRMKFIALTALQSHDVSRVLPVVVANTDQRPPEPLHNLPPFRGPMDLLNLDVDDTDKLMNVTLQEHRDVIKRLFDFVAKPSQ